MMFDFVIGNDNFGKGLAKALNCGYRGFKDECYPDGEPCPRLNAGYEEIEGKNLVLVSRISQKPTEESMLKFLHTYERTLGQLTSKNLYNAKRVVAAIPYYVLGRQDHNARTDAHKYIREKDKGKDVGYETLARILKGLGAERMMTFDPHFYREEGVTTVCGLEIAALSGVHALGRYFKNKTDKNTVVLGLDENAGSLSHRLAGILNLEYAYMKKKRVNDSEVEFTEQFDAKGQHVIFADDIFSTLGTVKKALAFVNNAASIYLAGVHSVLPKVGYDRLADLMASERIVGVAATDTIDSDFSRASVIPELAAALKKTDR